jgi:hypothetical protein
MFPSTQLYNLSPSPRPPFSVQLSALFPHSPSSVQRFLSALVPPLFPSQRLTPSVRHVFSERGARGPWRAPFCRRRLLVVVLLLHQLRVGRSLASAAGELARGRRWSRGSAALGGAAAAGAGPGSAAAIGAAV